MELHLWLSLVTICILGAISPGPSLALVIKNTLSGGPIQGYSTALSHGLGVALYAAITVTGIGLVIVQSPILFSLIQYTGAAFLLYLGVKSLLSKKDTTILSHDAEQNNEKVHGWRDGFLIAFLNPKLAIFFLALFSQFIDLDATLIKKVIMIATVGCIDALWYSIVTFGLSRGDLISKLRAKSHLVDKVTGGFLILLAARVVLN
ncbi:MAG: LysE family translocator [Alteromonadaceae bacterium]|nr:LysE family translocator [Alteromonadaceae bacterium]